MRSSMSIKVEFLAGTRIEDAVKEAKDKAKKLDMAYICFNFNGAEFSIGRGAEVEKVVDEWEKTKGKPYGIVHA